ncbi:nucleotidyltransferase family protein [Shewanella sp. D64]|uniref:nucleotidyltransferase family protein n=1 Tax=unclassified Shewanella TaxID=196818 RepID=UPI0022BA3FE7|nr:MULTISPECIES: nucleotidyltransferase family protein [unclassified Shewanella]MEC4726563.1 nucleotidyltransferase family protein [Shewanella sp. D64]MEC4737396.1 nucleotidyltransferase family protein [Shewanella sp. E94]WBJ97215.1 nucleotidyltransferase family protein [Shewanella sp. MTB7]
MNKVLSKVTISPEKTLRDALQLINAQALQVALVTDDDHRLLGIITDGDIRRGLLNNLSLDALVTQVMNTQPRIASPSTSKKKLLQLMQQHSILSIPLVKNDILVGLETLKSAQQQSHYANPVLIMAGGFGTRLKPLTDRCPKPMLKVGNKPLLEIALSNFIQAGFTNFYISTHYMPEQIKQHFDDGSQWGINITYVHEETPLGTGGAVGLLPKNIPQLPTIVMNGDILTKVDFQLLLKFHDENNADATMCVREYDYQIPYGVISGEGSRITDMVEKPIQRFFINAGIYVINQDIVKSVTANSYIDMPTLLEQKIAEKGEVLMFPIHEYWLDIGRMGDFQQAQVDICALGFDQ